MNIRWLDNNGSEGLYVLELMFADGKKGYLKGNYEDVGNYYDIQWKYGDDVVGQVIYDPQWKVVAHRYRTSFSMAS